MTRAVLSIDPLGALGANGTELTIVKVVRAPWIVPDQGKAHALQLAASTLPAWHEPHAVRLRGQCVRDALAKHPGVARMLDLLPGQIDVTPLYLVLSEGEVELIGWETLCDRTDAFLSLDQDQRFPIGRIVEPSHDEARAPSSLRLPIRLMAIISAIGADGRPEWEHLFEAVKAARGGGAGDAVSRSGRRPGLAHPGRSSGHRNQATPIGCRCRTSMPRVPRWCRRSRSGSRRSSTCSAMVMPRTPISGWSWRPRWTTCRARPRGRPSFGLRSSPEWWTSCPTRGCSRSMPATPGVRPAPSTRWRIAWCGQASRPRWQCSNRSTRTTRTRSPGRFTAACSSCSNRCRRR